MRFRLEDIEVFFPYESMYREQLDYCLEMKRALDAPGHAVLEMPTGTGKTVCLMSLITSYQYARPEMGKLIYCTRTVPEMVKCVEELKRVVAYREQCVGPEGGKILALCLSSRRNMCIHDRVMEESDREAVDATCRGMTASWVRKRAQEGAEVELCDFYENYDQNGTDAVVPYGIYSLEDLRDLGRERGWCPYFLARHVLKHANVLIYNYQYMLDPKVAGLVSSELEEDSVVVFDEAHNIDNVCIEAMSVQVSRPILDASTRSLSSLSNLVEEAKRSDAERLNAEYQRLVSGLAASGAGGGGGGGTDTVLANPSLPADILAESVPGNIRKAEHFLTFMRKIVRHLKDQLRNPEARWETPQAFLHELHDKTGLEAKPLKFTYSRLNSLLRTLEVTSLDDHSDLSEIADFATLLATYQEGFAVVLEPDSSIIPGLSEPVLELSCLDASVAIKPVFKRFRSVIITSGTLSPIDLYPRILDFHPVVSSSLPMSIFRSSICPLVVTRGDNQTKVSSAFGVRDDDRVVSNYGKLLVDACRIVPDGMVVFFPSYLYMESIIVRWDKMGILKQVTDYKLLFIETKDVVETTLALDNFRTACECGRGAVFLSVARGKVAEGIDFDRHLGRAVMMFGVPFQYTKSLTLKARLDFLHTKFQINEADFITFDAMRQASQCAGRVFRSKTDYGLMIFADARYNQENKRNKLPPWIRQFLGDAHCNLSTTMASSKMRRFLREMAQPVDDVARSSVLLNNEKISALAARIAGTARAGVTGQVAVAQPAGELGVSAASPTEEEEQLAAEMQAAAEAEAQLARVKTEEADSPAAAAP
eukprot:CAMPEP_0118854258 /NCGR_PEP_ID=MMETSP1163-20130328/2524_1 /TAXON_ID=124430 /ORGANISM="Phaeomonas parva, Strain CCMP2877" /LENGTH=819 /DNA_ID=CAMNT_0006786953 /DNA_START=512 /DNA_END=2968 /DNA_ORIENTATION=+